MVRSLRRSTWQKSKEESKINGNSSNEEFFGGISTTIVRGVSGNNELNMYILALHLDHNTNPLSYGMCHIKSRYCSIKK